MVREPKDDGPRHLPRPSLLDQLGRKAKVCFRVLKVAPLRPTKENGSVDAGRDGADVTLIGIARHWSAYLAAAIIILGAFAYRMLGRGHRAASHREL